MMIMRKEQYPRYYIISRFLLVSSDYLAEVVRHILSDYQRTWRVERRSVVLNYNSNQNDGIVAMAYLELVTDGDYGCEGFLATDDANIRTARIGAKLQ